MASLVSIDSASFFDCGKDLMGYDTVGFLWGYRCFHWCVLFLVCSCGSCVLAGLVHVVLGCGQGLGEMFVDICHCDVGPGCEVSILDGLDPG